MELSARLLEYLKAVTTFPVVTLVLVVLGYWKFQYEIRAILKHLHLRSPSGWEVMTHQEERTKDTSETEKVVNAFVAELSDKDRKMYELDQQARGTIQNLLMQNTNWEFRYLSLYLVRKTQLVLFEWFFQSGHAIRKEIFNDLWRGRPEYGDERERDAVILALVNSGLLREDADNFEITPKGRYFLQFMKFA